MKLQEHRPLEEEGACWTSCTHHEMPHRHNERELWSTCTAKDWEKGAWWISCNHHKVAPWTSKVRVPRNGRFVVDQLAIVFQLRSVEILAAFSRLLFSKIVSCFVMVYLNVESSFVRVLFLLWFAQYLAWFSDGPMSLAVTASRG